MDDLEGSLERAYKNRREEFVRWLNKSEDESIDDRYLSAIAFSDEAIEAARQLAAAAAWESEGHEAFVADLNRQLERHDAKVKQEEAELADRERHPDGDVTLGLNRSQLEVAKLGKASLRWTVAQYEAWREVRLELIPGLQRELLAHGFVKEEGFSRAALIEGVKALFGAIPVAGSFIGLAWSALELAERDDEAAATTQHHVKYLKEYVKALEFWCKVAQATTDRMRSYAQDFAMVY
jgi:hypothetical protein